jgi:hypothetical protein
MCRKARFTLFQGSLEDENGDCWPEYDGRQWEKEGQGSVIGADSILEGVTAAAEERQLSHNSLIAYWRTWLRIIAWAAAEGLVLKPSHRKGYGSSMRRRPAAEVPHITSRSKLRSPFSITFSVHQIPLLSVLPQSSPPRKPSCATTPLPKWANCCASSAVALQLSQGTSAKLSKS